MSVLPPSTGPTSRDRVVALLDGAEPPAREVLSRLRLIEADLSDLDLSGIDLSGLDLSGANLSGTLFHRAVLRGTIFFGARMERTEFLASDLTGADLSDCVGAHCGFGHANLTGAQLVKSRLHTSTFTGATLVDVDGRAADLTGSRLREADLSGACMERAKLRETDLTGATVTGATFRDASLVAAELRRMVGYTSADWIGVDVRDADFRNAWLCRRHLIDENFLWEFRNESRANRAIYWLWWATSDCGRSLGRWGALTAILALAFAGIYDFVEIDYGSSPTWLSPLYFSIVTMTTLGYGDALPTDVPSQIAVIGQVVVGYVMLGGLMSIFAAKMGRRGE